MANRQGLIMFLYVSGGVACFSYIPKIAKLKLKKSDVRIFKFWLTYKFMYNVPLFVTGRS